MKGWGVQGGRLLRFPFNQHSVSFLARNVYIAVNATHCRTVWAPNLRGRVNLVYSSEHGGGETESKHGTSSKSSRCLQLCFNDSFSQNKSSISHISTKYNCYLLIFLWNGVKLRNWNSYEISSREIEENYICSQCLHLFAVNNCCYVFLFDCLQQIFRYLLRPNLIGHFYLK